MLHNAAVALAALAITLRATAAELPVLGTTVIQGSSAYSPAELFETYRDQLGRPVSRDGAGAIVVALQELYARDGYSRPEVAVDDDSIGSAILRIAIFEPQITRIAVEGSAGPHHERVWYVASRLQGARPVRRSQMQDALRELRELPGLTVTAHTLRDAAVRNGFELKLQTSFQPLDGMVRFTNRGTEEIGPVFALSQLVANGLLGRQERIGVLTAASLQYEEYHGAGAFLDAPLDAVPGLQDTRAMLMGFRSTSEPTEAGADVDDRYLRDRVSLRVTHRMDAAAEVHWTTHGGLELEDLAIEQNGAILRDDQLRIATLGSRIGWRSGASTQNSASADLLKGLDALGAGLRADDLAVDERRLDFTVLKLQYMRVTRFLERWSVRLDAFGQYSGDVLPDTQRFKIGGDRLGRGFEVAEIAGDSGIGTKVELRRELIADVPVVGRAAAYAFYDFGAAWKENAPDRQSAATAGLGLASTGEHFTAYVEVAAPLTHADVEGSEAASVFAELSYRF